MSEENIIEPFYEKVVLNSPNMGERLVYMLVANFESRYMDYHGKEIVISDVAPIIFIDSIVTMIDDDNYNTEVTVYFEWKNGFRRFKTPYASLIASPQVMLTTLSNQGYFFPIRFTNDLLMYLSDSAFDAMNKGSYEFYHQTLGFLRKEGYQDHYLVGNGHVNGYLSKYIDQTVSFVKGSRLDYENFLRNHVLPNQMMRLAFVIGMSAIVASRLQDYADIGTLIVNFSGASSTGKTTAAQMIASLYGDTKIQNTGLVRTFNQTQNHRIDMLKGVHGCCIVYDDATSSTEGYQDRASMIYQMSQSEPRSRLNSDGTRQKSGMKWSGTIVITSETPILDSAETRMGLISRVIDTDGVVWTNSAEHAEAIKREILKNYGHIGPLFASKILLIDDMSLQSMYDSMKEKVLDMMVKKSPLSSRIASKIAIIGLTAELISNLLAYVEVQEDEILKILIEKDQLEVEEKHVGEKALEVIKNHIITHHHQFEKTNKSLVQIVPAKGVMQGRLIYNGNQVQVIIPSSIVDDVLRQNYIYDKRIILKYWSDIGIIRTQSGRNTIKDSKLRVRSVFFIFEKDENSLFPWYETESEQKPSVLMTKPERYHDEYDDTGTITEIFKGAA